jgi:hypothetical protein
MRGMTGLPCVALWAESLEGFVGSRLRSKTGLVPETKAMPDPFAGP